MNGDPARAAAALDRRYLLDHPLDAALAIEKLDTAEVAVLLANQPAAVLARLWPRLAANAGAELLCALPPAHAASLLAELLPTESLRFLAAMDDDERQRLLALLDPALRRELEEIMSYPEETAGRLMDTRITTLREHDTASHALTLLRKVPSRTARSLFLVDDANRLTAKVTIQDLAVAEPTRSLKELSQPVVAAVQALAPHDSVVDLVERYRLADLPVVDLDGRLIGVIYHSSLVQAMQEDLSADIQTMVGASRDERALSQPLFSVRKRLPWLQINLLTAFLAAAVVGLFESTIAQFTALAVLLPVVAGQSGNAGAQALAVTMRGLALREVTVRQWLHVTLKEVSVGLLNGLAVAVTCGAGVYLWSGSIGLVLVISLSMVLAMIMAGFAGAVVPMMLTRLGQDPAQSSSIILTTVTDVAGFMSFLGIATALSALL